jgi:hypothetical protein
MQQLIREKWCTPTLLKKTNIMVKHKHVCLNRQADPPVTIVIQREVIPGLEVIFERLASELSITISAYPCAP